MTMYALMARLHTQIDWVELNSLLARNSTNSRVWKCFCQDNKVKTQWDTVVYTEKMVEKGREPGSFTVSMSSKHCQSLSKAPVFPARVCDFLMAPATASSCKSH